MDRQLIYCSYQATPHHHFGGGLTIPDTAAGPAFRVALRMFGHSIFKIPGSTPAYCNIRVIIKWQNRLYQIWWPLVGNIQKPHLHIMHQLCTYDQEENMLGGYWGQLNMLGGYWGHF